MDTDIVPYWTTFSRLMLVLIHLFLYAICEWLLTTVVEVDTLRNNVLSKFHRVFIVEPRDQGKFPLNKGDH